MKISSNVDKFSPIAVNSTEFKEYTIRDDTKLLIIGKSKSIIKYSFKPKGKYKTLIIIANLQVVLGSNLISSLVKGI